MRLFPFGRKRTEKALRPADSRGGWLRILEPFTGAWQKNIEVNTDTVLAFTTVYSCITLIANDIAKLRVSIKKQENGIWSEVHGLPEAALLRRPNHFQNSIQFFQAWLLSKLTTGNAYILKVRNEAGRVASMFVLDPRRVKPLVADDGSVFYQLNADNLSGLQEEDVVPARDIIHDRMNCLFHPLVGVSPIYACGLAATQGMKIQNNSALFFENMSRPSGLLVAPGKVSDETAERLKKGWEDNYSQGSLGRTAVLGDDLKYIPLTISAADSQLIEQLKWSAETVCSAFHVPGYMIGVGPEPTHNNIESRSQQYYTQCLQTLIEEAEAALDDGLELDSDMGVEFDLDGLLRMDTASLYESNNNAVGGGWMSPNEARRRVDLPPVEGGETPYLQQQNYSLSALNKRDQANPLAEQPVEDITRLAEAFLTKELNRDSHP